MAAHRPAAAVALVAAVMAAAATAQTAPVGTTRWSPDGYVEYIIGNAPIVVSAGHGGELAPASIPDRSYGTLVQDVRTLELAREFGDQLATRFRLRPHVVLFHLSRRKVDVNRDIVEGAQGNALAVAAYNAFHQALADARTATLAQWGHGFYLDLHGHGHPEAWIELGYSLSATQLALSDSTLAQPTYVNQSSIRSAGSLGIAPFASLLRGGNSLGAWLQSGGYNSVPSPVNPSPNGGNYFSGGFNVDTYGSSNGTPVDGVQIEAPITVRNTVLVRRPFLDRTGGWLETFFQTYRGGNPALGGRVTIAATDRVASESGGRGEFVLTRTGDLASTRLVPLAWRGTAIAGVDFVTPPTSAWFGPGIAEVRIPVQALDDLAAEGDETVQCVLAAGNDVGVPNAAEVVLHDDDLVTPLALHHDFESIQGGVATDASGNNRPATLLPASGGPLPVPGRFGQGLRTDGIDDRARIADFAYGANGEFSLAFWFRTADTTSTGSRYLVSHGGTAASNRLGIWFEQATGTLRTALLYANDLSDVDVLDVTRDLRDGLWHHYALVAHTDDLVRVWIDGQPETAAMLLGDTLNPVGDFVLGARSDLGANTFANATIDDLRLWTRPLSAIEVALLQAPLGAEAMVYAGTGEDVQLATGVGGTPTAGPRHDVKRAAAGTTLLATFRSPGGTFDGGIGLLAGDVFATGAPFALPQLPWLHMAAPVVIAGPVVLGPAGGSWSISVPPGLGGTSLMLQPTAIHSAVQNGVFALGDGHEIRL
jgi:hypothetical protein